MVARLPRSTIRNGLKLSLNAIRKCAIYADKALLVINKPAGMVSQPSGSTVGRSIIDSQTVRPILEQFRQADRLPRPCHRLDKETTGALLCGRNAATQAALSEYFSAGTIERKYLAIVRGGEKSFKSQSMKIQTHIDYNDGTAFVSEEQSGKPCETHLTVLATSPIAPLTLVQLVAKTGRKHQLRVHMTHIGAPILGDSRYASNKLAPQITEVTAIPEGCMYLHGSYLSFPRYRKQGHAKRFQFGIMAPLPQAFIDVCDKFQLPLHDDYVRGGVYVDGERRKSGIVPEVEGHWLLESSLASIDDDAHSVPQSIQRSGPKDHGV